MAYQQTGLRKQQTSSSRPASTRTFSAVFRPFQPSTQPPAPRVLLSFSQAPQHHQHQHQHKRQRPCVALRCLSPADAPVEEADYDQLTSKVAELTQQLTQELRGCNIYLVGMMGSGKSTVGKMLANTLKYAFFDTDSVIELAHDKKPVSDIFKEFGQEYFRTCESQIIRDLSPYKNLVVSTGGGAVLNSQNWGYMQLGIVCWLNGDVEVLARRVAKDGIEKRPLLHSEGVTEANMYEKTVEKLSNILEDRKKYYLNADLTVPLTGYGADAETGAPTAVVMYRLLKLLYEKVLATKAEKEDRKNFRIEYADEVRTMRTIQSPVAPSEGQQ